MLCGRKVAATEAAQQRQWDSPFTGQTRCLSLFHALMHSVMLVITERLLHPELNSSECGV